MTKKTGMLLLGIWLIMNGVLQLVSVSIPFISIIMAGLAIAAGIFILRGR